MVNDSIRNSSRRRTISGCPFAVAPKRTLNGASSDICRPPTCPASHKPLQGCAACREDGWAPPVLTPWLFICRTLLLRCGVTTQTVIHFKLQRGRADVWENGEDASGRYNVPRGRRRASVRCGVNMSEYEMLCTIRLMCSKKGASELQLV